MIAWGLPAGSNALHAACSEERTTPEVVKALRDHGARTDLKDQKGQTPVDVAETKANATLLAVLGARGKS